MGSNRPLDRQSMAYREMTEKDRVADEELDSFAEAIHDPADAPPVHGPEWWEQGEGWDTGREGYGPKSIEEAEAALASSDRRRHRP